MLVLQQNVARIHQSSS